MNDYYARNEANSYLASIQDPGVTGHRCGFLWIVDAGDFVLLPSRNTVL